MRISLGTLDPERSFWSLSVEGAVVCAGLSVIDANPMSQPHIRGGA
jgi:hypothetical protein